MHSFINNPAPRPLRKYLWVVIMGIALFLRLHFILTAAPSPLSPDELGYTTMAKQFVERGYLGYNNLDPGSYSEGPNAFVTPGYPLFVAACYIISGPLGIAPELLIMLFQAILSTVSVYLVYAMGLGLGGRGAGYLAAALAAVYPPFIYANARLLTEVLFTFFITWYAYIVLKSFTRDSVWLHLTSGLLLGFATLIRPAALPLILLPYLLNSKLVRHQRGLPVVGALAGLILIMMPWWIRNYLVTGKVIFLATQTGNPFLRGTDPYDPFDHIGPSVVEKVPPRDQLRVGMQRILEGLKDDPRLWISWYTLGKLKYMWWTPWGDGNYLHWLSLPMHRVIALAGLAGGICSIRVKKLRWPAMVILYFTLMQMAFIPLNRYVFPTVPLLMALSAAAFIMLFTKNPPDSIT